MNRDREEFESLRKLMALKRWEQPPPAYFHDLPGIIISRLRVECEVEAPVSWWQRLVVEWELKPILVGAYSVGITGLLLVGISLSEAVGDRPMESQFGNNSLGNLAWTVGEPSTRDGDLHQFSVPTASSVSSTLNPVLQEGSPPELLFNGSHLMAQPAAFRVGN
jgi:hypothetical protein